MNQYDDNTLRRPSITGCLARCRWHRIWMRACRLGERLHMSSDRPLALTLQVRNIPRLANGGPFSVVLDRRSATIGRASSTDWSLPDPDLHISGRRCDILFRNGGYELVDNSTNGTFVNADARRLSGPYPYATAT